MGQSSYVGNSEPAISEVLADPIVHLVMLRDHLKIDEFFALIARARETLFTSQSPTNSAVVERAM